MADTPARDRAVAEAIVQLTAADVPLESLFPPAWRRARPEFSRLCAGKLSLREVLVDLPLAPAWLQADVSTQLLDHALSLGSPDVSNDVGRNTADRRKTAIGFGWWPVTRVDALAEYGFERRSIRVLDDALAQFDALPPALQRATESLLQSAQRASRNEANWLAELDRRSEPADPMLRRAVRALWDARSAYREVYSLHPMRTQPLVFEPERVLQRGPHGGAQFHLTKLKLHVDSGANDAYATALIDRLIDGLTTPTPNPDDERLRQLIQVPKWRQAVNELVQLTYDPSEGVLGWRLKAIQRRWDIEAAVVRPRKQGGYTLKKATADEIAALSHDARDERLRNLGKRPTIGNALDALIGHPWVFVDGQLEPTPVVTDTLQFALDGNGEWSAKLGAETFEFLELPLNGFTASVQPDTIRVAPVGQRVRQIAEVLARTPRGWTPDAWPELASLVPGLSAAVGVVLPRDAQPAEAAADNRIVLRVRFEGTAVHAETWIAPLIEAPRERPGDGRAVVAAVRNGRPLVCTRDFAAERAAAADQLQALAAFPGLRQPPYRVDVAGTQALALAEAIDTLSTVAVEVDGTPPQFEASLTPMSLQIRVTARFDLVGEAKADTGVVALAALFAALREDTPYVPLSNGAWARITDALRDQLNALEGTLSPWHAPQLHALASEGAAIDAAPEWLAATERFQEAPRLNPDVPAELQTTLRSYQIEAFQWAARLAHWAPGALLADDMGLGKTLVAIALLLHRSKNGPALVVAPVSVTVNWERELARFAPSLRVVPFTSSEPFRAGDVVILGYERLVRWSDPPKWRTVVIDEAQGLKNPDTQRAHAVLALKADFRFLLSGTPVENRAEDLWGLFRHVAPGLLGTLPMFRERHGSGEGRRALARWIRPFMLRRSKHQVSHDLPPRTDILLEVELSEPERVLYQAARREGLAKVLSAKAYEQKFVALTALTRMRQAACHPRLLDPNAPLGSAKLDILREKLVEVRAAGHRALVFSQFTQQLAIVREALAVDGFRVRYLDGSLSAQKRRKEMDAFQAGEADVFLISLKAGGTGLNLTAATYVFHLDPWWNPAVEDQASDRAHRLGQTEPVTVYRLVARDTIETQIVALHRDKRELADALLNGTDQPAPLALDELLTLFHAEDD